jgi:acetylornithine aminotransferase
LQQQLADRLCAVSHGSCVLRQFRREANEAAIRLHACMDTAESPSPAVIVMEKSFHGRTLATLTATGNRRIQAGEPPVRGFLRDAITISRPSAPSPAARTT